MDGSFSSLRGAVEDPKPYTRMLGDQCVIVADPVMTRLYNLMDRLAPGDLPVLIMGETGTGKELVAAAIHTRSLRRDKPMLSLNCAALHEALVESELFGHERGAFSGAVMTRVGFIEASSESTLFLDEIGELSPMSQAKLLRVLETQRVIRVGDVRERSVDVRVVAATNRDLEAEVIAGRFRRDLYFRLAAAVLPLPPLRQRRVELPLLARMFLKEACLRSNRTVMQISEEAMTRLLQYDWPGNIRELRHLMHYVAVTATGDVLQADHLGDRLRHQSAVSAGPVSGKALQFRPLADELRELEMSRIREALEVAGGNKTQAAALLAVPVRTFFEKVKLYGLAPSRK